MNDADIISLYFRRDQQAITETSQKYGRYCYTIAWNILYNNEDSEECVNDAYLDTWRAIPPERPLSLKAFVGKITRNKALNRYERNNAAKRGGKEVPLCLDELAEIVSGKDDFGNLDDYNHLVTLINHFLSSVSKEQRIIFVRRYWYESSIREIARDLGIGESKVKVTLSRMRGALKTYLAKEGIRI